MNENELWQDDAINLFDLWVKLRNGWKAVVIGLVLGIAGALAGIALIPPTYEAIAVIQVGRVSSQPVEPSVQTVARMKTPAFQRRVAEAMNDQEWLQNMARFATGITKTLSFQVIDGSVPLIEVRAEGENPEIAQRRTEATIAELVKAHDELAQPALTRLRSDLEIQREKLASAERDLVALAKSVETTVVKDERFTQIALMTSLRTQKEAETFAQRQTISALETALSAPATQPTRPIERIFVPEKPISPKKALLLILGSMGGLLIGILWIIFTDSWQRARRKRQESALT